MEADRPALRVEEGPAGPAAIVLAGVADAGSCLALAGADPASVLRVRVARDGQPDRTPSDKTWPDLAGTWEVLPDGLRFRPAFPFEPGIAYRANFDPGPLGLASTPLWLDIELPRAMPSRTPSVEAIHPSGDRLPENLLRFRVTFSTPMRRGLADTQIALVTEDGTLVPDVLYRPPVELWDASMRHLTVLLDPGRLKRGVGPNRALGPPLRAGETYALVVGAGMVDASGIPLPAAVRKPFQAVAAVRTPVETARWTILPPDAGSRQPLAVRFPVPLDRMLLPSALAVLGLDGARLAGRVTVGDEERDWAFVPDTPWGPGLHHLEVSPGLEDVCGNTPQAPFDRAFGAPAGRLPDEGRPLVPFRVGEAVPDAA